MSDYVADNVNSELLFVFDTITLLPDYTIYGLSQCIDTEQNFQPVFDVFPFKHDKHEQYKSIANK